MMTGVGTSHLVTAPAAGGRFEFALLWCIPVAYIFKYYGFEMAFRFTNATGRSMLDAYTTAPGKWPVWYVLVTIAHPVRARSGGPAGGGRRGAVLRLLRVFRSGSAELGLRALARWAVGRHHPLRAVCGGRAGHQAAGRSAVRLDRGGLPGRAGAALGDGSLLHPRGAGRVVADHRRLPRAAADRYGCVAAGVRMGQGEAGRDGGHPGSSSSRRGMPDRSTRSGRPERTWRSMSRRCRSARRSIVGAGSGSGCGTSRWDMWCRSCSPRYSCCSRRSGSIRVRWRGPG